MQENDATTLEYRLTLGRVGGKERDGPGLLAALGSILFQRESERESRLKQKWQHFNN